MVELSVILPEFNAHSSKGASNNIRSGETDPVQFKGCFKEGPFCL